jgi:hypothetical protein
MIPDKIYIYSNAGDNSYLISPTENVADKKYEIEYIRKDFLLEWAEKEMDRLYKLLPDASNENPTQMELRYLGQYMQMENLIDKLESL